MSEAREHVAFGGSYLIHGALYVSHLYDIGDGTYGWELRCVDHEGNQTASYIREAHPDVNGALLWTLSRVLDYAMSLGIEPDELQIVQQSCCPTSDPEFIALVLHAYHESLTAARH